MVALPTSKFPFP